MASNKRKLRNPMSQKELCIVTDTPVNRPDIKELLGRSTSAKSELSWAHKSMQQYEDFRPLPASEPCDDYPGSLARIKTYMKRVANGESLWHENDRNARV